MKCISNKRCVIGEGPIWNNKEQFLYFTNALGNELCSLNIRNGNLNIRENIDVNAIAFDNCNRTIISNKNGVFYLNDDNSTSKIYDTSTHKIFYANDMKVGPDGRIYVGTQSSKRLGISNKIDGKLYSISKDGSVRILLDSLSLSNGMDWSMDGTHFYHTDSDMNIIREYTFDKSSGNISFTSRSIEVEGVDGFTIDINDNIYAACWGRGQIAIINTQQMKIIDYIDVPANLPASCCFCGKNLNILCITSASLNCDISNDINAGFTFIEKINTMGRLPYLFGG